MPARIGILRVSMDSGTISANAQGQLTAIEWLYVIEMTKQRLLSQSAKTSVVDLVARKVDGLKEKG